MGHYRSEMGYEEQDRKEAEAKAQAKDKGIIKLRQMIIDQGIEAVLYDIIKKDVWL